MNQIKERFRKELLESCVPFWLDHAIDTEYGGLINCLDREGKIYSSDKSIWMQGRAAWMFSYLYNNIEKNEEYLKLAKSCLDFLEDHSQILRLLPLLRSRVRRMVRLPAPRRQAHRTALQRPHL